MTQPIQEPTIQRQLRSAKYGIDQLFRRPCVNCGGDLPYAHMYWYFPGGEAVPTATQTGFVDLGSATASFTTDASIFTPTALINGAIEWDNTTQHGAPALAKAEIVWAVGTTWGPRAVSIIGSAAYDLDFDTYNTNEISLGAGLGTNIVQYQQVELFFFLGRQSESETGALGGSIYHEMGGDEDIVWAAISIIRLNPASEFTADPGGTYFP